MGKPMGNGFPVAALVVRSDVLGAVPEETELFSTFGGNPVACAAALAVLAVIEDEGLAGNAAEVGGYLLDGLRALQQRHPAIGDAEYMQRAILMVAQIEGLMLFRLNTTTRREQFVAVRAAVRKALLNLATVP